MAGVVSTASHLYYIYLYGIFFATFDEFIWSGTPRFWPGLIILHLYFLISFYNIFVEIPVVLGIYERPNSDRRHSLRRVVAHNTLIYRDTFSAEGYQDLYQSQKRELAVLKHEYQELKAALALCRTDSEAKDTQLEQLKKSSLVKRVQLTYLQSELEGCRNDSSKLKLRLCSVLSCYHRLATRLSNSVSTSANSKHLRTLVSNSTSFDQISKEKYDRYIYGIGIVIMNAYTSLQVKYSELLAEHGTLGERLSVALGNSSSLKTCYNKLVETHNALRNTNTTIKEQLVVSTGELGSLNGELVALKQTQTNLKTSLNKLRGKFNNLKGGFCNLSQERMSLATDLERIKGSYTAILNKHSSLCTDNTGLKATLVEMKFEIGHIATELGTCRNAAESLCADLQKIVSDQLLLFNEEKSARKELSVTSKALRKRGDELKAALKRANELTLTLKDVQDERDASRRDLLLQQELVQRLNARYSYLIKEYEKLKKRSTRNSLALTELTSPTLDPELINADLSIGESSFEKEYEDTLQCQLRGVLESNRRLEDAKRTLVEENKKVVAHCDTLDAQINDLRDELNTVQQNLCSITEEKKVITDILYLTKERNVQLAFDLENALKKSSADQEMNEVKSFAQDNKIYRLEGRIRLLEEAKTRASQRYDELQSHVRNVEGRLKGTEGLFKALEDSYNFLYQISNDLVVKHGEAIKEAGKKRTAVVSAKVSLLLDQNYAVTSKEHQVEPLSSSFGEDRQRIFNAFVSLHSHLYAAQNNIQLISSEECTHTNFVPNFEASSIVKEAHNYIRSLEERVKLLEENNDALQMSKFQEGFEYTVKIKNLTTENISLMQQYTLLSQTTLGEEVDSNANVLLPLEDISEFESLGKMILDAVDNHDDWDASRWQTEVSLLSSELSTENNLLVPYTEGPNASKKEEFDDSSIYQIPHMHGISFLLDKAQGTMCEASIELQHWNNSEPTEDVTHSLSPANVGASTSSASSTSILQVPEDPNVETCVYHPSPSGENNALVLRSPKLPGAPVWRINGKPVFDYTGSPFRSSINSTPITPLLLVPSKSPFSPNFSSSYKHSWPMSRLNKSFPNTSTSPEK